MSSGVPASITVCPHGPLIVRGNFGMLDGEGRPVPTQRGTVALCRCGGSKIKPFCDGTHKLTKFDQPGGKVSSETPTTSAPDPTGHSIIDEENAMNQSENEDPITDTVNTPSEAEKAKAEGDRRDHVSDPSLSDEIGHDWSDEGGATEQGPATNTEAAPPGS